MPQTPQVRRPANPFCDATRAFRMHLQPARLGWAGNTDWTMRERRGEFYIFQQHDDQVSPTYVADLVEAASRTPNAAICFAEMHTSGLRTMVNRGFQLSGASNPYAQLRKDFGYEFCRSESEKNPFVAGPLKRTDCSLVSDGAAALVLTDIE